jgi:hypothetical protein
MLRRVGLVITDVSEESSASIIRVTRIGELGRTLAVISNRRTLCTRERKSATGLVTLDTYLCMGTSKHFTIFQLTAGKRT